MREYRPTRLRRSALQCLCLSLDSGAERRLPFINAEFGRTLLTNFFVEPMFECSECVKSFALCTYREYQRKKLVRRSQG